MSEIRLESEGPVRRLIMDAPERRNALTRQMLSELAAAVSQVGDDPEARAVVVSGAGSAFCAGADLGNLFGDPTRPVSVLRTELKSVYDSFWLSEASASRRLPQSTVPRWEPGPISRSAAI